MKPDEALQRAARLCSQQERSSAYIRGKLENWGVSADDIDPVIQKLKAGNYIDDNRYATSYVRDKFRLNLWGKIKINHSLRQRGIREEIILSALEQIDDEAYFETCKMLVQNKNRELKDKNIFTRKAKLLRFAAQRGFESDIIYKVLNMLDKD